jgi:hypothetical protein
MIICFQNIEIFYTELYFLNNVFAIIPCMVSIIDVITW